MALTTQEAVPCFITNDELTGHPRYYYIVINPDNGHIEWDGNYVKMDDAIDAFIKRYKKQDWFPTPRQIAGYRGSGKKK